MEAEEPDDNSSWIIIVVTFKAILYIAGVLGNVFVIFVITFLKEYKKTAHWYLLQLSIADLVFLNTIPFKIAETMRESWGFSTAACKAVNTGLYLNYYTSVIFLTVMAVDRFTAVCYPLTLRVQVFRTPKFCYWVTAVTWLISFALCIPVILYSDETGLSPHCVCSIQFPIDMKSWCRANRYSNLDEELCREDMNKQHEKLLQCYNSDSNDSLSDLLEYNYTEFSSAVLDIPAFYGDHIGDIDFNAATQDDAERDRDTGECGAYDSMRPGFLSFVYINFAVMFVFPLLVISICYGFIVFRVAKRMDIHSNKFSSVHGQHRKIVKESKRVTMVCGLLVVSFAVCWSPFHAYHLVKVGGIPLYESRVCHKLAVSISILAYANSTMNPFIYNFFGKNFRARIRQIRLRRQGRRKRQTGYAPTNSSATTLSIRYKSARI